MHLLYECDLMAQRLNGVTACFGYAQQTTARLHDRKTARPHDNFQKLGINRYYGIPVYV